MLCCKLWLNCNSVCYFVKSLCEFNVVKKNTCVNYVLINVLIALCVSVFICVFYYDAVYLMQMHCN